MLELYDWPGNVRELRHAVERAVILANGERLTPDDFPFLTMPRAKPDLDNLDLETFERKTIKRALSRYQGNISQAADVLGPDPARALPEDGKTWALAPSQ